MNYSTVNIFSDTFRFTHHKVFILLLCVLSVSISNLAQAAVDAHLDRNHIYNGDTITLHITVSGQDQDKQPDLSPLKKDFDVLGTSSSSQIQIINGYRTDKHEWQIELAPHSKGKLTIPALSVGNDRTSPLLLTVSDVPVTSSAQAGQPVFIKSEISSEPGNTYVQQQILYTTRLYYRIPLIEGSFTDPKIDNAVVEQLGEDKQYNTTVKGQSYQVLERRYAIFPEHSGTLTIPSVVFNGRTVSQQQQSPFGQVDSIFQQMLNQGGFNSSLFNGAAFGSRGKRVHYASNPVSLNVKPQPADYSGSNWLPTEQMNIEDSWAKTPPVMHAGEPVTRTVTMEAKGLEASQLPDIQLPGSDSLRIYPEKSKQSNRTDGDWIYGQREQRFTYVSSQPGKVHFPAVKITWWNSLKQKEIITTLSAYDINVLPGNGQTDTSSTQSQVNTGKPAVMPTQISNSKIQQPVAVTKLTSGTDKRLYWITGGILLMFILSVIAFLLSRQQRKDKSLQTQTTQKIKTKDPEVKQTGKSSAIKQIHQALHSACVNNQPRDAEKVLLQYASIAWPQDPPRSLAAIAARSDIASDVLLELETVLYSAGKSQWNGQRLWKLFKDGSVSNINIVSPAKQDKALPPLYPDWKNIPKKAG